MMPYQPKAASVGSNHSPNHRHRPHLHGLLRPDHSQPNRDNRAPAPFALMPGFYSCFLLVPKKNWLKLQKIHSLHVVNRSFLNKPPWFRMVTLMLLLSRMAIPPDTSWLYSTSRMLTCMSRFFQPTVGTSVTSSMVDSSRRRNIACCCIRISIWIRGILWFGMLTSLEQCCNPSWLSWMSIGIWSWVSNMVVLSVVRLVLQRGKWQYFVLLKFKQLEPNNQKPNINIA